MKTGHSDKNIQHLMFAVILLPLLFIQTAYAKQFTSNSYQQQTAELVPLAADAVPAFGTFWLAVGPNNEPLPPYPCLPQGIDAPIYDLGNGQFLVDDSDVDYVTLKQERSFAALSSEVPMPGDGEGGEPVASPSPDTRRNSEKFMNQVFLLLDTNALAYDSETNLLNACLSFPANTNGFPNLQILSYGANCVLIKANHFDYSEETERDFALLVCDSVEKPTWKNIDLSGSSDAQDGWLIQGLVPKLRVTDPMYMMVTNIAKDCNAFFRAIPYGGPSVQLSGAQAYDTVSNIITLQATISDLSGATNQHLTVFIDGIEPRYAIGVSNAISIDTRYTGNDYVTVSAVVGSENARVQNGTNVAMNTKTYFESESNIPLLFQNSTYVYFSGDMSDPDIGTNYFLYGVTPPHYIRATISEPGSGRIIKSFSGYNPSYDFVQLSWNFLDTNAAPYTNDFYILTFTSSATPNGSGTTLANTNKIENAGVRPAHWQISNFEEVKPSSESGAGSYINSEMARWGDASGFMYETLYFNNFASQTQYFPWQIGTNRNTPTFPHMPFRLNPVTESIWPGFIHDLMTNRNYSDFNYGPGHANGYLIGGGEYEFSWFNYVNTKISAEEMVGWVREGSSGAGGNKRYKMRKVSMWGCYTARIGQGYVNWPTAFGIASSAKQLRFFLGKNAGLFFNDDLRFAPYGDPISDVAEVAAEFEKIWVGGESPYPGGANPNYSIQFALDVTKGVFPELNKASPVIVGFPYLPFAGVYDDELMVNDITKVVQ